MLNDYIRHVWQPGLELTALMLDYYEHTLDEAFLQKQLLPMARDVLRYFDTRFPRDAAGKLVIQPTQAVETYWYDVVNDLPSVAGLIAVTERLLALPPGRVPPAERELCQRMQAMTPPLPIQVEAGVRRLMPAEKFNPKRSNVENVELYAIWPFRLLGVGRQNLDLAVDTFRRRPEKASIGWQYDGQSAAAVGLADEAATAAGRQGRQLESEAPVPRDVGAELRLAARPGPRQQHHADAAGDADPPGRRQDLPAARVAEGLERALQAARARRTVVEGEVRNGELVDLQVTPAARRRDVIVQGSGRITNTSPGR